MKSSLRSDTLHWKELFRKSSNSGKIALLLSSWFGLGLLPWAPGTAAAAIAVAISFGLKQLGFWVECGFLVLTVCAACWSCDRAWRMAQEDDPSWIVIDEVIGLLVSLLGSLAAQDLVLGFVLFRVFDIWKPYPVGRMERLSGAKGILMDDLLAGVLANLCLRVFHLFG